MSVPWAEARSYLNRLLGLARRGAASLRARGWRATWQRLLVHARAPAAAPLRPLYLPAPAAFVPFTVPASEAPQVSIVIPVYNHVEHTLACLRALAAHPPLAACEVLVIDDGSSDDSVHLLPQIGGLRYEVREHNGGFIEACNDGVARSRGQYVVLLNNDTVPQPGWLEALLQTFLDCPQAGLVGAQLLYPEGRLQESGGVVFADGSAWSYGRFESADDPRYASLRDCDYCSGAALMLPRALWDRIGGFDTRFRPAYYEDTDLAFQVRALGLRTLVQPASRVVHDEGTSNGTDTGSGVKAYQVRNRAVFAQKWAQALAQHLPPGAVPGPALLHRGQRQVLVLDEEVPQPQRDSGSLRQFNLLRLLLQEGVHVVFVPTGREHGGAATEALQRLGVEVWHAPFLHSLGSWLRTHGGRFDVVMMVRHHVARECLPLLQRYAPRARRVFDTVDLHYLRERRGAELAGDAARLRDAERTRHSELAVMQQCNITVLVSSAEREQLRQDAPQVRVELISNLHEVAGAGAPYGERHDLVFVGGFRHPPNLDAMQWFIGEVFPRIRQQLPRVQLHCIGAGAPQSLLGLAAAQPGVRMHGFVDDIAPYMEQMRIAVAPLRFGAGVKGKINLSMAHGQPVVGTTCAVEGMHLVDGVDVCVADDAAAFAAAVVRLHEDPQLWQRLSTAGLANVAAHFSLDAARDSVRRVFVQA